jgi:two-component system chemotaxis response regulator CheB
MANRDILAIGTSAGGFAALRFLARKLPGDFPASILVTIHLSSQFRSRLDEILTDGGALPAGFARDDEMLQRGRIYLAPPERHLIVNGERLRLGVGPRENNARPAIDPMLRSAAACCGGRTVGVILTGNLADGAAGLQALKRCGGITVVQDPRDAAFPDMPTAAMSRSQPDHVVKLADMPAVLEDLVRQPPSQTMKVPDEIQYEVDVAASGRTSVAHMDRIGRRSVLACPDCHGVMWEVEDDDLLRYRCHVGHAYTAELMSLALDANLRRALASALRAVEERVMLAQRLKTRADTSGRGRLAAAWDRELCEFESEATVLRDALTRIDETAARLAVESGRDFVLPPERDATLKLNRVRRGGNIVCGSAAVPPGDEAKP